MPYALAFHPEALREWRTLSAGIREQFKKKLAERLIEPRILASKLRGFSHHTKIKLLAAGSVWAGVPSLAHGVHIPARQRPEALLLSGCRTCQ